MGISSRLWLQNNALSQPWIDYSRPTRAQDTEQRLLSSPLLLVLHHEAKVMFWRYRQPRHSQCFCQLILNVQNCDATKTTFQLCAAHVRTDFTHTCTWKWAFCSNIWDLLLVQLVPCSSYRKSGKPPAGINFEMRSGMLRGLSVCFSNSLQSSIWDAKLPV